MSFNQSKSDKNDSQYRKSGGGGRSGSSGQQRTFTGGSGRGSGGGSTALPPVTNPSSLSTSRSFKKTHNAQGVQSRVTAVSGNATEFNGAPAARAPVQNGSHSQSTLHAPAVTSKPNDAPTQRSTRPIPKAPSSQSSSMTLGSTTASTTLAKGDGAQGFPLQFGSINPGFMNGMQIPRTISAPPNIDEQKRDKVQHEGLKGAAPVPVTSAPKPQVPIKDVSPIPQHITGEMNADLKVKLDAPVTSAPLASQAQKPAVLPMTGISMQMSYPQPSVPMQFGGPNPPMQSQGMPATSLPMPMQIPIHMGNPSQVHQQVFMPGIQHTMMQPQGFMHQSQSLGFNPQMSQLPHPLGGIGMNLTPQFSPQQPAKYGNIRKTVKITHPETHEELRLEKKNDMYADGSSASRTHHGAQQQAYTSGHPISYYSNSYTAAPPFFAAPSSSLPLTSAQLTPVSQAPRINYHVGQTPQTMSFLSHSASSSISVNKGGAVAHGTIESSNLYSSQVIQNAVSYPSASVTIKPAASSSTVKSMDSRPVEKGEAYRISRPAAEMSSHFQKDYLLHSKLGAEQLKPLSASVGENIANETTSCISAASHGESSLTSMNIDGMKKEAVAGSASIKENQKNPIEKGHAELGHQAGIQVSLGSSQTVEGSTDSSNMVSSLPIESKKDLSKSGAGHGTVEPHTEQSSAVRAAPRDDGNFCGDVVLENSASNVSEVVGSGSGVDIDIGCCTQGEDLSPQVETSGAKNHGEKENLDLVGEKMHSDTSTSTTESLDAALKATDCKSGDETVTGVYSLGHESDTISVPVKVVESSSRAEGEGVGTARPSSSSGFVSNSNKAFSESNKSKGTLARGKKKIKHTLQKADAQGTPSDLYMAYRSSEENKEDILGTECTENTSSNDLKPVCGGTNHEDASIKEKDDRSKAEPDDWEDAADVSTPKLQSTSNRGCELTIQDGEEAGTAKKYSRDFLLTFSEQYTNLPDGFEINSAIADILVRPNSRSSSRVVDREYPSPGRIIDLPSGGPKVDRRGSGMIDADRWNKLPGPFQSSREMGLDPGHGPMSMGFRPVQGGNYGVLRNPRGQPSGQYPILSGPTQSMQRNHSEDRWRVNFKGLMPPPYTPMRVMHKAEKKYEVGKVTDEEQAKQRKLKGILNKLTPQNFDKLFAQVKEVNIDNVITLTGVISQIFDKALMEPTFCEMYSNFCYQLSLALPELSVDDEKVNFKRLLLNKCQEEFERGEREEEEANNVENEDQTKLSAEEREEKRLKARRRMLGNIRLIGELYKKRMLTERIMHECIKKLLGQYPNSAEEDIESLCKLMSTIGEMIDHPTAKEHMDVYFNMMANLSNNTKLSSRVRFMLKDVIDLRKNKWQQRRKVEGPKKIEEVHRDAAQERQAQATRLNRGPSMGSSMRRGQPVDFGPKGSSTLSSPAGQMGSFRGLPSQVRGYGIQDVRMEERNSFDSRTISVPLPQRQLGDDAITLGPQGGLARGMSIRGQPSVSSAPLGDNSLSHGDARRTTGGLNGYSSMSEHAAVNSREDSFHRYTPPERLGGSRSSMQGLAATTVNRDRKNVDQNLDRPILASPPRSVEGMLKSQNMSSERIWPEERLREKSIAAIREFYSAKDEKEVDTCVRELNAPSFHPSVISIWVTDSFERKELERDMLNNLIVELSKPHDGRLFMPDQLIKGIETVLTNLEDTVNDAPKAPDYLGRLLASVILENVVSLQEIGGLLCEGGAQPGRLLEEGLAGDVLGSILENIKSEKGESTVKDICTTSNLRLEDFRPPEPLRSKKLELFI